MKDGEEEKRIKKKREWGEVDIEGGEEKRGGGKSGGQEGGN